MIVEFTGCSGAGKTSLARRVRELLRERTRPAIDTLRLVLGPKLSQLLPARSVSTRTENVAVELLGWRRTLLARRHHAACDGMVRSWIREVSISRGEWLRLSRSWNRKLAVLASIAHCPAPPPVLLHDEGTVHFAMTLLARWPKHPFGTLERYLEAVPLPTYIVCVDASPARRLARLAHRSAEPVPDRDQAARDHFFERSCSVIESLCQHPLITPRLVRVANDQDDVTALNRAAHDITNRVIAWQIGSATPPPIAPALNLATH